MVNERARLYHNINVIGFVIVDMIEYLDTHPYDKEAIEYLNHYLALKHQAMAEYAEKYGPLSIGNVPDTDCNEWKWATQPMPWEGGF
jgi:spore coat protein JB